MSYVPSDKHIDTAAAYKNETEVGQGIKASGVPRESFFLTTKLDNPDQGEAEQALEASLKNLGVDYLDLWVCRSAFICSV
jgi:glycerol 2-dehydrogenase (NADP+)